MRRPQAIRRSELWRLRACYLLELVGGLMLSLLAGAGLPSLLILTLELLGITPEMGRIFLHAH